MNDVKACLSQEDIASPKGNSQFKALKGMQRTIVRTGDVAMPKEQLTSKEPRMMPSTRAQRAWKDKVNLMEPWRNMDQQGTRKTSKGLLWTGELEEPYFEELARA